MSAFITVLHRCRTMNVCFYACTERYLLHIQGAYTLLESKPKHEQRTRSAVHTDAASVPSIPISALPDLNHELPSCSPPSVALIIYLQLIGICLWPRQAISQGLPSLGTTTIFRLGPANAASEHKLVDPIGRIWGMGTAEKTPCSA